jgi:hypothetical protein
VTTRIFLYVYATTFSPAGCNVIWDRAGSVQSKSRREILTFVSLCNSWICYIKRRGRLLCHAALAYGVYNYVCCSSTHSRGLCLFWMKKWESHGLYQDRTLAVSLSASVVCAIYIIRNGFCNNHKRLGEYYIKSKILDVRLIHIDRSLNNFAKRTWTYSRVSSKKILAKS